MLATIKQPRYPDSLLFADATRIRLVALRNQLTTKEGPTAEWRSVNVSVTDGDWDTSNQLKIIPVEKYYLYKSFRSRFVDGAPWQQTAWFRKIVELTERGKLVRGHIAGKPITSTDDFLEFVSRYDRLYADIRDNGYKMQWELGNSNWSEIRIGIDRGGRVILLGGRHRFIISRLLKLEKIPMLLAVRHAEWDAFRNKVIDFAHGRGGRVYQIIDHLDLNHLPASQSTKRLDMIAAALGPGNGRTLLDLGTHWGYFPQQLERLGFDCTGIEFHADYMNFAEKIRIATGGTYRLWQGDLTQYEQPKADVVLALSIFHHLVQKEAKEARLIKFLQRLETDLLIFEPPVNGAGRYSTDEFVSFVSQHARLPAVQLLGSSGKRPIYRLSRS